MSVLCDAGQIGFKGRWCILALDYLEKALSKFNPLNIQLIKEMDENQGKLYKLRCEKDELKRQVRDANYEIKSIREDSFYHYRCINDIKSYISSYDRLISSEENEARRAEYISVRDKSLKEIEEHESALEKIEVKCRPFYEIINKAEHRLLVVDNEIEPLEERGLILVESRERSGIEEVDKVLKLYASERRKCARAEVALKNACVKLRNLEFEAKRAMDNFELKILVRTMTREEESGGWQVRTALANALK